MCLGGEVLVPLTCSSCLFAPLSPPPPPPPRNVQLYGRGLGRGSKEAYILICLFLFLLLPFHAKNKNAFDTVFMIDEDRHLGDNGSGSDL
jgi:hypothetical protein